MVDNSAGGNIGDRTADEITNIFETMASSSQQKSARGRQSVANAVTLTSDMTKQLAELSRQMELMRTSRVQAQQVMVADACEVCGEQGHGADVCPRFHELSYGEEAQANAVQGFQQGQFRPKFDPFSNSYNPGWRHHPNFSWSQNQNQQGTSQGAQFMQPQQNQGFQYKQLQQPQTIMNRNYPPPPLPQKSSLEDTMHAFMQSNQQRIESVEASVKRIETQVGQLAETVEELVQRDQKGKMPSQPKQAHAVSVILRGDEEEDVDEEIIMEEAKSIKVYTPPIPFPSRLVYEKQGDGRKKVAVEDLESVWCGSFGAGEIGSFSRIVRGILDVWRRKSKGDSGAGLLLEGSRSLIAIS